MENPLSVVVFLLLGFSVQQAKGAARLEARIVDDATGEGVAARVAVTGPEEKFVEIEGQHPHAQYLGKRWCYVDGSFALTLTNAPVNIEIRRGLETRPELAVLTAPANGATLEKTFRLRRWTDMRQKGYFTGDIHAHAPIPSEALLHLRVEDLNAVSLMHMACSLYPAVVNEYFTGRLDTHSTPDRQMYVGQEIRDWQMGHLTLLGLTNLAAGYPDFGGSLEYWTNHPNWDLGRAVRSAHDQKGMVVWSHFCSLPGAECAVAVALGWLDGIELITWNDPTQFPNHFGPWLNSGLSRAELPVLCAVDHYYQYLNAGFRVPIAAGTDKFVEDIPLGSNRTYVRTGEPANYAAWLEGIKRGRTFVSNGPLLEFEAAGQQPGDVVDFQGRKPVKARVVARSILPFTTLEIVMNGATVGHKTIPSFRFAPVDGVYSMEVEATVELTRSGWLAARVVDHPDLKNRVLPRDLSVFAHTSPVYFLRDGRQVREEASLVYLRNYVKGVLHWLDSQPPFASEEDRRSARREAEQALRIYQRL